MKVPGSSSEEFATTRWTRVLAAGVESREAKTALSELCEIYYAPVHAFIRGRDHGLPEEDARDLTHAFFAGLLENPGFTHLEKGRGRFRNYLLGAVTHFLNDRRKHRRAAKRGGGEAALPLGDLPSEPDDPGVSFDREWAVALIEDASNRLVREYAEAGKAELFETLKPWLNGNAPGLSQAGAASAMNMSEGAVKVAIHRLRKRFRELVTAGIRETVEKDEDVPIEMNYLIEVLRRG